MRADMSPALCGALRWLGRRNGDGGFDLNGVLLAAGELAPFMRATWNGLRDLGLVEFYEIGATSKRKRVRITPAGFAKLEELKA